MYGRSAAGAAQSSFRDRTREFHGVAERLRKKLASPFPSSLPSYVPLNGTGSSKEGEEREEGARSTRVALQSEFNKRASKIGFGIYQTSQKLSNLAKLAKRTSVFDDPTMEIQELTAVIKQEITALNAAVVDLQLVCNFQNGGGSTSSDTTSHSTTVVDDLKNRLMGATKEFKELLTMRTENMKVHENRRQLFSSTAVREPATNPFTRQRPLAARSVASASAPSPWANQEASSSHSFSSKQQDAESQPMLQRRQQLVPVQDPYMQSRSEALQNVESTIHELGNIFTQLATMVSQQGELSIRIDDNMEETMANVDGAQGQLVRYLNTISSNRWLMIKIFFALIVFLTFFFLIFRGMIGF